MDINMAVKPDKLTPVDLSAQVVCAVIGHDGMLNIMGFMRTSLAESQNEGPSAICTRCMQRRSISVNADFSGKLFTWK